MHLLWWLTAVDALAETCSENRNKFHSDLHLRNKWLFYYKYCLSKEILTKVAYAELRETFHAFASILMKSQLGGQQVKHEISCLAVRA